MILPTPRSTLDDTLFPYTTRFDSASRVVAHDAALVGDVLVEEVGGLPPGGGDLGPRSAPQRGAHVVGFGQPGDCHAAEPEGHDHDGGDDADWSRGPHAAIDSSAGDSEAATAPRRRSAGRTPDMSTTRCTPAKAALLSVPGDWSTARPPTIAAVSTARATRLGQTALS